MSKRQPRCECGQLTIDVSGERRSVGVCRCLSRQRRTGSVFTAVTGSSEPGQATESVRAGMAVCRRDLVAAVAVFPFARILKPTRRGQPMYGLIVKMTARPGKRDALIDILLNGVSDMPGCLSYIVAQDPASRDLIWITEVWVSREAHMGSLSLPSVQAAITAARPIIAGMESVGETTPVGGQGLD